MSDLQAPPPQAVDVAEDSSLRMRLRRAWDMEFASLRWRHLLFTLLARLLPEGRAAGLRTALIRAIGLDIGAGTRFMGVPKMQSTPPGPLRARLRIGTGCTFGTNIILEFGETLTIGNGVSLSDGVVILTTSHQIGPKEHRAGPAIRTPVAIGNDAQIGANSIVLPGARIGDGARVMPDSVVNANVAPGVTVSGIPARPVRPA
jgi:acetyltransferase-like isoleucine patch superfamily enzyme